MGFQLEKASHRMFRQKDGTGNILFWEQGKLANKINIYNVYEQELFFEMTSQF